MEKKNRGRDDIIEEDDSILQNSGKIHVVRLEHHRHFYLSPLSRGWEYWVIDPMSRFRFSFSNASVVR
jgi:hypothetical protein